MTDTNYGLLRTLRCKDANVPGTLGRVATAIGSAGGNIRNVISVHLGSRYHVRDIEVIVDSEEHLNELVARVSRLRGVEILQTRDEVLELHKNGKIKTVNTVPIDSLDHLSKVYTPGVAEVCKLIVDHPGWTDLYTSIPYTVAIVTDGTAVLGLGNIGAVASMPVMEGKSALIQQLVGINGVPILLDTTDPDEIVETMRHIAPSFAGIHLEDIASPRCFEVEDRLQKELDIPVMHDDQHGTAVVTLAALINACKLTKRSLEDAKIGLIGLGAAGLSIGKIILQHTGKPALGTARTEASRKRHAEHGGIPSSLDEIMKTADIVVGTSGVRGLIDPSMVRKGQIILALTNPYPEIAPERARAAGAALAADGRAVNNLLGYPGLWRGTLDTKATTMNFEMYRAAALAIADATSEGELVPTPLDAKAHLAVTHSVARAAVESGVARVKPDDDYFENTNVKEPRWA